MTTFSLPAETQSGRSRHVLFDHYVAERIASPRTHPEDPHERLSAVQAAERLDLSRSQVSSGCCRRTTQDGPAGLETKKRSRPSNRRHSEEFGIAAPDPHPRLLPGFRPDAGARETDRATPYLGSQGDTAAMDDRGPASGSHVANARSGFSSHAADATALANWCRSTVRITGSSRNRGPKCALLVYIDDATGKLLHLTLWRIGEHIGLS